MNKAYKADGKPEPYSSTDNYEISLYRGDDLIDSGTIKEVAARRGCQKRTIVYYTMPSGHRRADRRKDQAKAIRAVRV
jgi:hypothetical protein